MNYVLIFLHVGCGLHYCTGALQISLNGADWILTQHAGNLTVKGQVPGSVHTDLFRAGVIGDPYYRFNDVAYSWISYSNWSYTKTFTVDGDTFDLEQHHLLFGGLDTIAVVVLNNIALGDTYNMFRRYDFNVTGILKRGVNMLQVHFTSPVFFAKQRARQYPYDVPPDCPPPEQKGECHFNFIRKEASSFSWDWGPSFPTIGIWKNVTLESYNSAAIRYVTSETTLVNASSWELKVVVFFDGIVNGLLDVTIDELGVFHQQSAVTSSSNYIEIIMFVSGVKPWWPNGYGKPVLYTTVVSYKGSAGDSDLKTLKIGFRTVELVQDKISSGNTFFFRVNGVAIFAKGSNWIPADSFQERITQSYIKQLLQSAVEANMNILRVWGGGVYESDEFYQLADELGVMIWQDFMFACALYPTDRDFLDDVQKEIIHQVRLLKRHPSIVIWAGNNENEGALANNWFSIKSEDYPRYYADYIKLYVVTVGSVVSREDTSRPFVTSSPSNGVETIAEGWVAKDPQSPYYGDVHDYDYTRNSWDWQQYIIPRFASEFGLQSWCSLDTLRSVSIPAVDWNMNSSFVNHRQHHGDGEKQMLNEIAVHFRLPNSTNATKNFADFVYLTQINQAMGIKTEVELYRRSQSSLINGRGLTMGALYWQLNDIWQAPTWASIEYGGKWKMLHYFAKKFFNRQLISPYVDGDNVTVYYIDDVTSSLTYSQLNRPADTAVFWSRDSDAGVERPSMSSKRNLIYEVRQHMNMQREAIYDESAVISGKCYKWNSFESQYEWNITFVKNEVAAQRVFTESISSLLSHCRCQNKVDCFLHFTDLTSSASETFLLLANPSLIGLEQSTIKVLLCPCGYKTCGWQVTLCDPIKHGACLSAAGMTVTIMKRRYIQIPRHFTLTFIIKISDVRRVNDTTADVTLVSTAISLFVWLNCPAFVGRFSDNGFLMSRPEIVVRYYSWSQLDDIDLFRNTLTVSSLSGVYQ